MKNEVFVIRLKREARGLLIICAILLFFSVQISMAQASGCSTPSFSNAQNTSVSGGPLSVTNGDFNRDGKIDLVTANQASSNVTVLFGNGTGGFSGTSNFSVASSPFSVTSGDFNGDGRLDIATANPVTNNISVLFGNGAGGFSAATNFATGLSPFSIKAADFNLDGKLDLATANTDDDTVSIHLGNGVGGFNAPAHIAIGHSPFDLTVGYFNRDAKLDIATANPYSDNITVLRGDGLGGFAAPQHYAVSGGPRSIQAADINADNRIDLITANESGNSVSVSFQNGFQTFSPPQTVAAGSSPKSVVVGDLNSDGKMDIAASNWGSSNVTVILGTGAGQLTAIQDFAVAGQPSALTIADLNRDGKSDLATSNVSVLLNSCNAAPCGGINWNQIQANPPVFFMQSVKLADINADTKPDIITAHTFADFIEISYGDGLGGFTVPFRLGAGDGVLGLGFGDFNREGRPDLITTNSNSDSFSVYLSDGSGGFLPGPNLGAGDLPDDPVIADFNSDGRLDVAMTNRNSENISVALNTCVGYQCTTPSFSAAVHYPVGGRNPNNLEAKDFNRDGKIDLISVNRWSNTVSLLLGDGLGGFSAPTIFEVNSDPGELVVGDFNKDGKLDVVTAGYYSSGLAVLLGDGNGGFAPLQLYGTSLSFTNSLVASDFNLDGNLDVAAGGSNNVSILFGNGSGGFAFPVDFPGGVAEIDTADINADGRPDLVTQGYRVFLNTCVPNVAPVAANDSFSTNINDVFTLGAPGVLANDTDLYNDPLTAALVSPTSHGTVVVNPNGSFTYTPNTGYFGSDSFTYRISDGLYTSNVATATINVRTINAVNDSVSVFENSGANTLNILANDFDSIGTPLITSVTQTSKGTIAITNGGTDVTYTPNPNFFGADSFQYTITGGNGLTDTGIVSIAVNSPVGCGVVNFTPVVRYDVGAFPQSIAAGDLDRDGNMDLLTANVNAGNVSVLFNTGNGGTFDPTQNFGRGDVALVTRYAITADLNADGFLDMIAVNQGIDHASIFLGSESGNFYYIEAYAGPVPTQVAVADLNSDGKLDLVATNYETSSVSLMLGYGTGAFMQPQQFPVSDLPYVIETVDINNDGKPDIVTGNETGTISVLLGNGVGGFAPPQNFGSNRAVRSLDFGDFDRDGNLDVVIASRDSYQLEILAGDGNGSFEPYTIVNEVGEAASVVVGDFNGDRRADIASSSSGSRDLTVLFGDSEGGFKREGFQNPNSLWDLAAVDINSDGYPDLVGTQTYGVGKVVTTMNTCNAISRFESDVAGRPWGDGVVQADDITLVRRFLSKGKSPDISEGEFRRADSAPIDAGGDGVVDASDVVQARRYAAGSDEIKPATGPVDRSSILGSAVGEKGLVFGSNSQLKIQSVNAVAGRPVTINVRADADGRESEYGFTIKYDPAILLDPVVAPGSAGAAVSECYVYPIGQLNCSVGEFANNDPSGSDANIGEIEAGQDQQLVTLTFQVASTAPGGGTELSLQNLNAANDAAEAVALSGLDGTVQILVPTAANVSISGKVIDRNGYGLARVAVTVTAKSGTSYQAVTNTFGYFVITNVPAGSGYVLSAQSKRETFASQIIDINDNVTGIVIQPSP